MSSIRREVSSDWDPLLALDHNMSFIGSSAGFPSFIAGVVNGSNDVRNEQVQSLSCFGLVDSPEFPSVADNVKGKKRKGITEFGASHSRSPPVNKSQNAEAEQQKNDEKKATNENADDKKEDYIHVRAKRGQATNSHSLAERVRREKISERMRLLQDLVPGCNKLTGKAMMLDEIINYVQSLQRQVEFLSMKLATVNPEVNFDIEQILSKDILQSQDGSSAALGFGQAMNIPHQQFHGLMQTDMAICNMSSSGGILRLNNPEISQMAQMPTSVWDHDLQNLVPMGFIGNTPIDSKEMNGSMKMEL